MKFSKFNLKIVIMMASVLSLSGCKELDVYFGICKLGDALDRSTLNNADKGFENDSLAYDFEERSIYQENSRDYDVSDLIDRMNELGANCVYIDEWCNDNPQNCDNKHQLKEDLADQGIGDCGDAIYCEVPVDETAADRPTRVSHVR